MWDRIFSRTRGNSIKICIGTLLSECLMLDVNFPTHEADKTSQQRHVATDKELSTKGSSNDHRKGTYDYDDKELYRERNK